MTLSTYFVTTNLSEILYESKLYMDGIERHTYLAWRLTMIKKVVPLG